MHDSASDRIFEEPGNLGFIWGAGPAMQALGHRSSAGTGWLSDVMWEFPKHVQEFLWSKRESLQR
jgi:hypothetical protein